MRTTPNGWLVIGVLLLTTACGDEASQVDAGPREQPGTLAVTMTSPRSNDGAVSFRLTGDQIENLRVAGEGRLFATVANGGFDIAVLGSGLSGPVLLFDVPDVNNTAAFEVTLDEVAGEDNLPRRDLTGYALRLARY